MYFGFDDISVRYGDRTVIDHASLNVEKGKITVLIGGNGSGKTTLFKTVSRVLSPKSGAVIFEGKPIGSYAPSHLAKRIAYLPQSYETPADLTVRTLVSYGRYPYQRFGRGMTKADRDRIDEALERTGLTELADRSLETLSGGERQRARIAMTVCQQAEILVLDEPTTHLDVGYQVEVLELIRSLNRSIGLTVLMVLHDLNLASRYCDVMCVLENGKIGPCAPPQRILTEETLWKVFHLHATILTDEDGFLYFLPKSGQGDIT